MRIFDSKSIVLGIGIGAIVISIISIIYTSGQNNQLSREEIISKAKQYGMIEKSESNAIEDTKSIKDKTITLMPTTTPVPVVSEVIISIKPGDTSGIVAEKLVQSGLISNKAVFINVIQNKGLASQINVGEYKIKKGSTVDNIIHIITA